jgi:hypothetical protein
MPMVFDTPQGPGTQDQRCRQEGAPPSDDDNAIVTGISQMTDTELIRIRFLTNQLLRERGIQYGSSPPVMTSYPRMPDEI